MAVNAMRATYALIAVLGGAVMAAPAAVQAAPGDLDPNFGTGGFVTTAIGYAGVVRAVLQQPDGKLVAVGYAENQFALARYLEDGSLDPSFGSGGTVLTPLSFDTSGATAAVRQPDGKLVVVGWANIVGEFTSVPAIGLARYDEDGALDPTFGNGGIAVESGSPPTASAVVLQPDGKIVVSAASFGYFTLARFSSTGSLDTTFGSSGYLNPPFGGLGSNARALLLQLDGKLVAAGQVVPSVGQGDFALARADGMGILDPTFGTGGLVTTNVKPSFDQAAALLLQPNGMLVAAGYTPAGASQAPRDFAVVRYDSFGAPDGTFGVGGVVSTDLGFDDEGTAAVLQPDGRIVVAGFATNRIGLVRYDTNGNLDGSFGSGGKVVTPANTALSVSALARQSDGKLVVGGSVYDDPTSSFRLARFLVECGNGSIDAGETCDDGNAASGDCCSSACQLEVAGTTCTSPSPCLQATCDGAGVCNVAIPSGCKQSTPLKSTLKVSITPGEPDENLLIWKWKVGVETLLGELGSPLTTDDYRLCGFDPGAAPAASVLFNVLAPAAATCPTGPCWKALGTKGFRYRNKTLAFSGVETLLAKSGATGKAAARIKAKGANLTPPALPLPLPVLVQLQVENGTCFETTFSTAGLIASDSESFRGRAD